MTDFHEDCELNIRVRSDGALVVESILQKRYPELRENRQRLWSIIEDNIYDDAECATIDWPQVWKEYESCP